MSRLTLKGGVWFFKDDDGATAVSAARVATAGSKLMTASIHTERLTVVSKSWNRRTKIKCPLCLPLIERQTNGYRRKYSSIIALQLFEEASYV
jgi:Flp pilus assembly pilin Flp